MNILAIDTSGRAVSVCVAKNQKVVSEFFLNNELNHTETLTEITAQVLDKACVDLDKVDVFGVTLGPGSFTGLRVGISFLKGLAFSQNAKFVGVSSLETLAYNLINNDAVIIALIDARNNRFYTGIFRISAGIVSRLEPDTVLELNQISAKIQEYSLNEEKIFFVGDGAEVCYNILRDCDKISLATENLLFQRASSVALAAFYKVGHSEFCDLENIEPIYLVKSQAERVMETGGN